MTAPIIIPTTINPIPTTNSVLILLGAALLAPSLMLLPPLFPTAILLTALLSTLITGTSITSYALLFARPRYCGTPVSRSAGVAEYTYEGVGYVGSGRTALGKAVRSVVASDRAAMEVGVGELGSAVEVRVLLLVELTTVLDSSGRKPTSGACFPLIP